MCGRGREWVCVSGRESERGRGGGLRGSEREGGV